jgi:hypothetical protein
MGVELLKVVYFVVNVYGEIGLGYFGGTCFGICILCVFNVCGARGVLFISFVGKCIDCVGNVCVCDESVCYFGVSVVGNCTLCYVVFPSRCVIKLQTINYYLPTHHFCTMVILLCFYLIRSTCFGILPSSNLHTHQHYTNHPLCTIKITVVQKCCVGRL